MVSSCDLATTLPEGPAPAPALRERHVAAALRRFDARGRTADTASNAGRRGPGRARFLDRNRPALAASAALLLAVPVAWRVLDEKRQGDAARRPTAIELSLPPEIPEPVVPREAVLPVPPTPRAEAAPATPPATTEAVRPEATGPKVAEPAVAQKRVADLATAAPPPPSPSPPVALARPAPLAQGAPGTNGAARSRTYNSATRSSAMPGIAALSGEARSLPEAPRRAEPVGRDRFAGADPNGFKTVGTDPVSTFSIDVDTASYSFARASLNGNVLPPAASVRTEELVNYFPYEYPAPTSADRPFRTDVAVFPSPWNEGRKIVRIGIKGYALPATARPRANLVFLVDTSGSMDAPNRLPLVKQSLALLLERLDANDRVAIVTYAGQAGTVLEPTPASEKGRILGAIENLDAGGSTAGGEGIRQAYGLAERNLDPTGVNRVILATDGDFNVGITRVDDLKGFVERERGKGIFLSVLGFGMGNYNDALMQALAQNGNGAAAYIDTIAEARKVMVEEATSTLFPIAKDVKIQVEFNPATVSEYRLVGYETRLLAREDFNNDKVDAGDVGSGQSVTALYEIVPVGSPATTGEMRYAPARAAAAPPPADSAGEYAFVKIRYKLPKSDTSELISTPVERSAEAPSFDAAPREARFATAVAGFAEILRGGRHTGRFTLDEVLRVASAARGEDPYGYRTEFLGLVRAAKTAGALRPARR